MTTRLGAVAFTVLWCELIYLYVGYPTHGYARLGEQYNCDSIQMTIRWCHIEVPVGVPSVSTQHLGLLRVLESSHRGAPLRLPALLVFTEEAAILDAPGRLSHTCTCQRRGKHWITLRERGSHSSGLREATQCTARHSLQNASFLLRGQMVANYHGMGNSTQT